MHNASNYTAKTQPSQRRFESAAQTAQKVLFKSLSPDLEKCLTPASAVHGTQCEHTERRSPRPVSRVVTACS